jgi:uncharacterized membrane protein
MTDLRIMIAGESWVSYGIHIKGFNAYYTGDYKEGLKPLREALESAGAEVIHMRNHEAALHFPRTLEEMSQFDVILFSDIGADTLLLHPDTLTRSLRTPNRLRVLAEYVEAGGGFAMIGGWMSFAGFAGQARYYSTAVEGILPVSISAFDDRVETPEGVVPEMVTEHEILAGIPNRWPHFLGYNRLTAKNEATVLLTCQRDPFLVVAERGRGRTAAFASDCSPHWGTPEFVEWRYYAIFWNQLVRWLAGVK